jgi:hypothetical protein
MGGIHIRRTQVLLVAGLATIALIGCNRELYNLAFTPEDLYVPLVLAPYKVSQQNYSYETTFENKYPGFHMIGFIVPNPPQITESYDVDFVLRVQIMKGEEILLSGLTESPSLPFWGGKNGSSGVGLMRYQVPEDLPEDTSLQIKIEVVKPSGKFVANYGEPKLFVKKFSDE